MAFQLQEKRTVWWPVTINVPIDNGLTEPQEVTAQFEILDQDEYETFAGGRSADLLNRVVVDWKQEDFQDAAGKPMPCSNANKATLWKMPYVRVGFETAYSAACAGYAVKNAKTAPASGQTDRS